MKCIIPGANVKVFGRAIHSLSKIGEELYIEALEYGLALRTVNSSRSAYACFIFAPSFFMHYSDEVVDDDSNTSDDEILKYKINMKSCLTVFKSLATLEKTVDKCKIQLDLKESRLVFQMYCRHGIIKTHNLAFIECETLQAVFSKDTCANILTAETKLLCQAVLNFQASQEEVTLILDSSKMRLKNYVDDDSDPNKVVHTQLSLQPDEFERYMVGKPGEVTFCLKELRAILAFSEPSNLPVSIYFDSATKPIVFTMETDPSFQANFVLATLADKNASTNCSQVNSQQRPSQRISNNATTSFTANNTISRNKPSIKERRRSQGMECSHAGSGDGIPQRSGVGTARPPKKQSTSSRTISAACQRLCAETDVGTDTGDVTADNRMETDCTTDVTSRTSVTGRVGDVTTDAPERPRTWFPGHVDDDDDDDDDDDVLCSPVIPVHSMSVSRLKEPSISVSQLFANGDSTDDEESHDVVPGTPPSKKFKSIFFNLSQSTTAGSQLQQRTVLAADTDDED